MTTPPSGGEPEAAACSESLRGAVGALGENEVWLRFGTISPNLTAARLTAY